MSRPRPHWRAARVLRVVFLPAVMTFALSSCGGDDTNVVPRSPAVTEPRTLEKVHTPGIRTIAELAHFLGISGHDTVKTMADYKLPAAAVGVLWNTGYFRQKFWFKWGQLPQKMHWQASTYPGLIPLSSRIRISLQSETLVLRLWKYYVYSYLQDYVVPLILLDADVPENSEKNRRLTDQLYRSDDAWIKMSSG